MSNEKKDRDLYRYPNSHVLRNKLNIRDPSLLNNVERRLVTVRLLEKIPIGNFDLSHLKAIHKHLFQDIYEWAGKLRRVDIAKTDWFLPYDRIETGFRDIYKRLTEQKFLKDLNQNEFSERASIILGDLNYAHPFREGNGRTQMQYFKLLCQNAGHPIDLTKMTRDSWIEASIQSTRGNYAPMATDIRKLLL